MKLIIGMAKFDEIIRKFHHFIPIFLLFTVHGFKIAIIGYQYVIFMKNDPILRQLLFLVVLLIAFLNFQMVNLERKQNYWDGENSKMAYFAIPESLLGWRRHPLPSLISAPGHNSKFCLSQGDDKLGFVMTNTDQTKNWWSTKTSGQTRLMNSRCKRNQ